jgi:hypothetical protein
MKRDSRKPEVLRQVKRAGIPASLELSGPFFVLGSLGGRIEHDKRAVEGGEPLQGIIGIVVVVIIVLVVLVLLGVI